MKTKPKFSFKMRSAGCSKPIKHIPTAVLAVQKFLEHLKPADVLLTTEELCMDMGRSTGAFKRDYSRHPALRDYREYQIVERVTQHSRSQRVVWGRKKTIANYRALPPEDRIWREE